MPHDIACYRCGNNLERLSQPFSRRDLCPSCGADVHVCKMCKFYDRTVPRQCREDGAEDVVEKERANFCDWFAASENAFDPSRKLAADDAMAALDALFDDVPGKKG